MNTPGLFLDRRQFTKTALLAGAALSTDVVAADAAPKRIRTGLIGCGSVSGQYLPSLTKCPFVEVVSLCDIKPERAKRRAEEFRIVHHYPNIETMLAGEPFDFLIDTTDMQAHEAINRRALAAGKHVWSEKPIANSLAAGQELLRMALEKSLRLWGAPITVQSPQFAFMAKTLNPESLAALLPPMRTMAMKGPTGPPSFTKKAADPCRISRSTTSRA